MNGDNTIRGFSFASLNVKEIPSRRLIAWNDVATPSGKVGFRPVLNPRTPLGRDVRSWK